MSYPIAPKRISAEELQSFLDLDESVRALFLDAMVDESRLALASAIVRSSLDSEMAGILLEVLKAVAEGLRANFVRSLSEADKRVLTRRIQETRDSISGIEVEFELYPDTPTTE